MDEMVFNGSRSHEFILYNSAAAADRTAVCGVLEVSVDERAVVGLSIGDLRRLRDPRSEGSERSGGGAGFAERTPRVFEPRGSIAESPCVRAKNATTITSEKTMPSPMKRRIAT